MPRPWVLFLCQPRREYTVCSTLPTCTKIQGSTSRSGHTSGWSISCTRPPRRSTHWCSSSSPPGWMSRLSYDPTRAELFQNYMPCNALFCRLSSWSIFLLSGTWNICRACNTKKTCSDMKYHAVKEVLSEVICIVLYRCLVWTWVSWRSRIVWPRSLVAVQQLQIVSEHLFSVSCPRTDSSRNCSIHTSCTDFCADST